MAGIITIAFILGVLAHYAGKELYSKWQRTRKERKAQKYLTEDQADYDLVKVYDDRQGNSWYAFSNPLKLPAQRALAGEVAMKQAMMNMDRDMLADYILKIKEHANKGELTTVFYLVERIEERLTWSCEEQTLLSLANVYFLLEGENPLTISDVTSKRKKQLMTDDIEAKGFFLTAAYKLIDRYSDISETDILTYLMEREAESASRRTASN